MLLPNSVDFILNRFIYDTVGTAEYLPKAIMVFGRCSKTFYRDCRADRREVDQLAGGVVNFEFPSSGIFNGQLKSDSRKDVDEELFRVRRPLECHAMTSSRFQLSRARFAMVYANSVSPISSMVFQMNH